MAEKGQDTELIRKKLVLFQMAVPTGQIYDFSMWVRNICPGCSIGIEARLKECSLWKQFVLYEFYLLFTHATKECSSTAEQAFVAGVVAKRAKSLVS